MKLIVSLTLLSIVSSAFALVAQTGGASIAVPTPPPPPTLSQDLEGLVALIPFHPLQSLVNRYLLNDRQFQTFIRMLNSHDFYIARMRLRSEPEVITLQLWIMDQLAQSGGGQLELEEFSEIYLVNKRPFWSSTVFGFQGFLNELAAYVPKNVLDTYINTKLAERGSFFQLWERLNQLKVVYERFIAYPETQRIIETLKADGINVALLDQNIRTTMGWVEPSTTTSTTSASVVVTVDPMIVPEIEVTA